MEDVQGPPLLEMAADALGRLARHPAVQEVTRLHAAVLLASDRASAMTAVQGNVTCGSFVDI